MSMLALRISNTVSRIYYRITSAVSFRRLRLCVTSPANYANEDVGVGAERWRTTMDGGAAGGMAQHSGADVFNVHEAVVNIKANGGNILAARHMAAVTRRAWRAARAARWRQTSCSPRQRDPYGVAHLRHSGLWRHIITVYGDINLHNSAVREREEALREGSWKVV